MADILLDTQAAAATPTAGTAVLAINLTTKCLQVIDDAGARRSLGVSNFSTASQAPAAATRTYVVGSNLAFAAGDLRIGTCFRWVLSLTKTAAGTAASTFDIALGTAGSTADTARVSFTKPAGTAVVDEATIVITAICRGPLSASGVVAGQFSMTHNLAATGHALIPSVNVNTISAAFDVTTPTNIGLCITSGTGDVVTFQVVTAEAWNI